MVWIPEVDEIPLSISIFGPGGIAGVTVKEVGDATRALCRKKESDLIGVRGPYGNGFSFLGEKALIVAGGIGVAPLAPLAEKLVERGIDVTFLLGVATRDDLVFLERIEGCLFNKSKLIVTTEDGSYGTKGFVTDSLVELLKEEKYDIIYTCGKERMMVEVFKIAEENSIPIQASLERYMKCGIGLCGHCILDPLGLRVCVDGPVFNSEVLRKLTDFGKYKRDATGRKTPVSPT
jgi:dihydroorotate dehydrogenase electron transfer subunit